jgi:hypothetical protein
VLHRAVTVFLEQAAAFHALVEGHHNHSHCHTHWGTADISSSDLHRDSADPGAKNTVISHENLGAVNGLSDESPGQITNLISNLIK